MGEIVIREIVFNPNLDEICKICEEEIQKDYPHIRVNRDLSDKDAFSQMYASLQLQKQRSIFGILPNKKAKAKKEDSESICIRCFHIAMREKDKINAAFIREIDNWLEINKKRLVVDKL